MLMFTATHPLELFLQLFPQGLGTVMKLVLQLSVALLEALEGPAFGLNISPLLERHDTHKHTQRIDEGRERERERNTTLKIHAMQIKPKKRCNVLADEAWQGTEST